MIILSYDFIRFLVIWNTFIGMSIGLAGGAVQAVNWHCYFAFFMR